MWATFLILLLNFHVTTQTYLYPYNNQYYNYGNYYYNRVQMPCMPLQRLYNPAGCVQYMKQVMNDPNMFWFGTRFRQMCDPPPADPRNVTCTPALPQGAESFSYQTLGSHMFQDPNYNASSTYLDSLQYPLTVTYTSTPEIITGCNTTVVNNQMLRFDVNPNMGPMTDFFYRNLPEINTPYCTTTSLCTVMFFDVGHGNIHNIWVNWPREPLSNYLRPGHYTSLPNPYAWLVFQQRYEISNFTRQQFEYDPFSVRIRDFMDQNGLTGPVGMTWQLALADLYGLNYLDDRGFPGTNLCPQLLDAQLRLESFTLLQDLALTPPSELGGWLAVRYPANGNSPEFWLNPLQNSAMQTQAANAGMQMQAASNAPDVFLLLRMFPPEASDYNGRIYTLILGRRDLQPPVGSPFYGYPYPNMNFSDKQYSDPDEDFLRQEIFHRNKALVALHNSEYDHGVHSFSMAINNFSDWTEKELSLLSGYKRPENFTGSGSLFLPPFNVELPKHVDWREKGYVTPVKNQNLVDCDKRDHGCGGGNPEVAFEFIRDNHGIDTEESYPYEAVEGECRFDPTKVGATDTGYKQIKRGDEEALKSAVATVGPLSVAIDARYIMHYHKGVFSDPRCSPMKLDHGVLVVGYGTEGDKPYWLVKNRQE